jgi:site-specific DNA-methyltransferase (adenine-specific)
MPISKTENRNCLEAMQEFPDRFFELAIVDPPYGKQPTRNTDGLGVCKKTFELGCDKWDVKPAGLYFKELLRVSKNQIIWGGNYFFEHLDSTNCFIVWDKDKTFNAFADCEFAWTSFQDVARIFRFTWNGMIQGNMKNKERRIHPTQKPVALYKWLLTNYAKQGDKILDTHLGSGSSRIACYDLGFDFYGYELDADYFDAQEKRFAEHIKQPKLFEPIFAKTEQVNLF